MPRKKRTCGGARPVRVGDLVHAWDCTKRQSMDVDDDDGHVIGYVRAINPDYMEVVLGDTVTKCWNDPIVVIQRNAARIRYYLVEEHLEFRHDTPVMGDHEVKPVKILKHGPYPGSVTARLAMRFLGEDRLKNSGITFRSIDKAKDWWKFSESEGPDREIIFTVIAHVEVRTIGSKSLPQ